MYEYVDKPLQPPRQQNLPSYSQVRKNWHEVNPEQAGYICGECGNQTRAHLETDPVAPWLQKLTIHDCPGTPEQISEEEQRELRASTKRQMDEAWAIQDSMDMQTANIIRRGGRACVDGQMAPHLKIAGKGKAKMQIEWMSENDMIIDFDPPDNSGANDSDNPWDPDEPGPSSKPNGASYLMYVTTPDGNDPVWAKDVTFNLKHEKVQAMPDGSAWRVDNLHGGDIWTGCATLLSSFIDAVIRIVLLLPLGFSIVHKGSKGW